MPAIKSKSPFVELMCHGIKSIETRNWTKKVVSDKKRNTP